MKSYRDTLYSYSNTVTIIIIFVTSFFQVIYHLLCWCPIFVWLWRQHPSPTDKLYSYSTKSWCKDCRQRPNICQKCDKTFTQRPCTSNGSLSYLHKKMHKHTVLFGYHHAHSCYILYIYISSEPKGEPVSVGIIILSYLTFLAERRSAFRQIQVGATGMKIYRSEQWRRR